MPLARTCTYADGEKRENKMTKTGWSCIAMFKQKNNASPCVNDVVMVVLMFASGMVGFCDL